MRTPPPQNVIHMIKRSLDQAFPLRFCILQAIKNWTVGGPGNEATVRPLGDNNSLMADSLMHFTTTKWHLPT